MGSLSFTAAHAIIWPTYGLLLISATAVAYYCRNAKTFLDANGTQKALPLAFNFVASGLGCGILSTYPQIANIDGIHGLLVYALAGGLPMFLFSFLGPLIRKKTPHGFILSEWVFHRFGLAAGWYLSACTILTMYLFMVAELASLKYAVETLTGIKALPVVIIECVVTSIYTSVGGFKISFLTDTLQVSIVFILIIIVSCAMGSYIDIDKSKIGPSGLLKANRLGWQLVYILVIAIFTNDLFLNGFWLRTFASRSDKDLLIGCSIAAFLLAAIVVVVGVTGFIAVWAGFVEVADEANSGAAFFILLAQLPSWVMGFTLVFVLVLSTCTLDSLQSALVSTISNDVFRNKLPIIYIRGIVVLIMIPVVVVGLIAEDVLSIYLIVDLLSSSVVPVLLLGLWSKFDPFWTAWEVIGGGLSGILGVFVFGSIYYHSAKEGGKLLLISNGLYLQDWGAFGAFVTAPVAGIVFSFVILLLRKNVIKLYNSESYFGLKFNSTCNTIGKYTYITKLYHFTNYLDNKLIRDLNYDNDNDTITKNNETESTEEPIVEIQDQFSSKDSRKNSISKTRESISSAVCD